jgi:hypothetical protein
MIFVFWLDQKHGLILKLIKLPRTEVTIRFLPWSFTIKQFKCVVFSTENANNMPTSPHQSLAPPVSSLLKIKFLCIDPTIFQNTMTRKQENLCTLWKIFKAISKITRCTRKLTLIKPRARGKLKDLFKRVGIYFTFTVSEHIFPRRIIQWPWVNLRVLDIVHPAILQQINFTSRQCRNSVGRYLHQFW